MAKLLKASNDILPFCHDLIPYGRGVVSSIKIDGNRGAAIGDQLLSSSGRPPRNQLFHKRFENVRQFCQKHSMMLDYEVYAPSIEHHSQLSGLLNSNDQPLPDDLALYVFDACPLYHYERQCHDLPFGQRMRLYHSLVLDIHDPQVICVHQRPVRDAQEARVLFDQDVLCGYEGSMLRATQIWKAGRRLLGGWYKHGRAVNRDQMIFKAKVYQTLDGRIKQVIQRRELKPDWPRERDGFGQLRPTYPAAAYLPIEEVGAFEVEYENPETGENQRTFIGWGRGWSRAKRQELWAEREKLVGRWVEFLHMPHGAKSGGGARHGRLHRFRVDLDT